MKVLSVRQPWTWLIVNGFKNIENRVWYTNYRGELLIHAALKLDPNIKQIRQLCESRGIVLPESFERGGIVGRAMLVDCVMSHPSVWFNGPYGLVLSAGCPLEFQKLRGCLGLFNFESAIEADRLETDRRVNRSQSIAQRPLFP